MDILPLQEPSELIGRGSSEGALSGITDIAIRGIDARWQYNKLLINVIEWYDTFLLKSIDGLGDGDIRDEREQNPGYHGETPVDPSLYGGRTLVFNGKIITRRLSKLREMNRALTQAFSTLTEEPLIMRTEHISKDLFIMCKKNNPLQRSEEQTTQNHFERTFSISLRASKPWFLSYLLYSHSEDISSGAASSDILNLGNFEAIPIFDINGPVGAGSEIINANNGKRIILGVDVPADITYRIDLNHNTLINTISNTIVDGGIDSDSDNLRLLADTNNVLEFDGTGTDSGSILLTKWRHTYIG